MKLPKFLTSRKRSQAEPTKPLLAPAEETALKAGVDAVLDPTPPPAPRVSKGRIIKQTRKPEYTPNAPRRGGRIVRVMPKQLQKIKAAQEKTDEDEPISEIED